jgi:RecB family exonuclease
MNDIIINKVQSIQRCIERAREEYSLAGDNFSNDYSRQDAAILNITRSCEQAIDLANHVIKRHKFRNTQFQRRKL